MIHSSLLFLLFFFAFHVNTEPKFETQVLDSNVSIGYGLAIGDVDGDRKSDILLADKKQFVWYRNGDWKRFVMAENLTESDNVCIAARDIDGDGKVEVAVGAQWNPSETSDTLKSGSVHYLIRPKDPTQLWKAVQLHHEPTVHRMRWVKTEGSHYQLIVLPLHGRGNKSGEGEGVKVIAYETPEDVTKKWAYNIIDNSMHLTHNMDVVVNGKEEWIYVGGKEGIKMFSYQNGKWQPSPDGEWFVQGKSFGEVRTGQVGGRVDLMAGIEPMHGNELNVYRQKGSTIHTTLTSDLNQGHALATADLIGTGYPQVVVGWREPNSEKKVGIKIYSQESPGTWKDFWIDDNGIACEDLQLADLDGDGKKDIIAAGRSSHNVKIYWNKNP
jgi:hypothetical protein